MASTTGRPADPHRPGSTPRTELDQTPDLPVGQRPIGGLRQLLRRRESSAAEAADRSGPAGTLRIESLPPELGRATRADPLAHHAGSPVVTDAWHVHGTSGEAVLKVLSPVSAGRSGALPGDWNYWAREVHAYRTGLAGGVFADAGIGAARMVRVDRHPNGSAALWLEYVHGRPWTPHTLADFARRLGTAQGRLAGSPPQPPWLSRRWLRDHTAHVPVTEPLPWDHPVAASSWPPGLRRTLRQMWERRAELVAHVERLPQTLCHLNVSPISMVHRRAPDDTMVLLDWAFTGIAGLGEDVGALVADCFAHHLVDDALLPDLAEELPRAYARGVLDAGWRGPADAVAAGVRAAGAARYLWLAPLMLTRLTERSPVGTPGGDDQDTLAFARREPLMRLLAAWGAEALTG